MAIGEICKTCEVKVLRWFQSARRLHAERCAHTIQPLCGVAVPALEALGLLEYAGREQVVVARLCAGRRSRADRG